MSLLGTITIPMGPWVWAGGALTVITLVLLLWSYRRAAPYPLPAIAWCLKLLCLLLLALCLMEPLWLGRRAKMGANLFAVVADNSRGMTVQDRGVVERRGDILKGNLTGGQARWLDTLDENFQVRRYLFDSRLRRTTDFADLAFDGQASAMGTTLHTLARRYENRPLAGMLLFTDGNPTDRVAGTDFTGLPPIYPVVVGQSRSPRDIALTHVSLSQTAFEDAPVTIQAEVQATDYVGRTVVVDLLDNVGQRVERQHWTVQKPEAKEVFHFRFRPDQTGLLFYHVQVGEMSAEDMTDTQDSHAMPTTTEATETSETTATNKTTEAAEATRANNKRTLSVNRGKGPYRILYVSGRPNWEFKFLQRALSEDEQVRLVALIRVAKREPKYDWRGHTGEQTNPLYRGFDPKEEITEQYDQPVLVRIYPDRGSDPAELRDGFPKTAEDLFKYHALILDDVDAEFFSQDQMDLVRRFVAERGAGFLMLGGKESFQQGQFARTPIGEMLPVYLDRLGNMPARSAYLSLTREGWLLPWARLRAGEQEEIERLNEMPEFRVVNRLRAVKPGARVVAQISDDQSDPFPALVVQRYGQGRSAALTVGDIWRWGLGDRDKGIDRDKFWRQMVRWLIADVPQRITLEAVHKPKHAQQVLTLRVQARQADFSPMDNVLPVIEVQEPQGQTVRLTTEPVAGESGRFEATYMSQTPGAYRARAIIQDRQGNQLGQAQGAWVADPDAREFRSIRANHALMEDIARQTGGQVLELNQLDRFAEKLPSRQVPITEAWVRPLWDLPGLLPTLFVVVLICLGLEWTLRRWRGMP
jgi:uncharacterized membrane protein